MKVFATVANSEDPSQIVSLRLIWYRFEVKERKNTRKQQTPISDFDLQLRTSGIQDRSKKPSPSRFELQHLRSVGSNISRVIDTLRYSSILDSVWKEKLKTACTNYIKQTASRLLTGLKMWFFETCKSQATGVATYSPQFLWKHPFLVRDEVMKH